MKTKACCRCHQVFQLTPDNFYRNRTKSDGFALECKACRKQIDSQYSGRRSERHMTKYRKDEEYRAHICKKNKEWREKKQGNHL